MQRKHTWVEDLYSFILSRQDTPYAWGTNDCCSFVADAILTMTGTDVFEFYRGKYSDEQGANSLTQDKVESVLAVTKQYSMQEIPVPFAQRGDLVLLAADGGFALGIVHLDSINVVAVAAEGLHKVPISFGQRSWRV